MNLFKRVVSFTIVFIIILGVFSLNIFASSGTRTDPYYGYTTTRVTVFESSIDPTHTVDITLLEFIHGTEANNIVAYENSYNQKPAADEEWILLKYHFKYVSNSSGQDIELKATDILWSSNGFCSKDGVVLNSPLVSFGHNLDGYSQYDVSMYPGGEADVWYGILVKKTVGYPLYRIKKGYDGNYFYTWFTSDPNVYVTGITLNTSTVNLGIGETKQLTATISPTYATNKAVSWSSNNPNIVTVDNTGNIRAVGYGSATITCTATDGSGKSATCNVTVIIPVTGITVNPASADLKYGETKQLTATISPTYATNNAVSWSSNNSNIVTVDNTGNIRAVGYGSATITCTATDGSGKSATCNVSVPIPVTGITVNPASADLLYGETKQLTATISPTNATNKAVSWSSNNSNIVTVDNTGNIRAVDYGSATITCTATDGSGKSATCNVNVIIPVTGITVNPTSADLKYEETKQLAATISPTNATNKEVIWTSSDTSVATVSSAGLVTAVWGGTTTITATTKDRRYTAICNINVNTPLISIVNNGTIIADTLQFKLPWYKSYKNFTAQQLGFITNQEYAAVEWSSDNGKVIIDKTGRVTNIKTGARSAKITVKIFDSEGNVLGSNTVKLIFYKYKFQLKKL